MYILPKTTNESLAKALQPVIGERNFTNVAPKICETVRELFGAEDALFVVSSVAQPSDLSCFCRKQAGDFEQFSAELLEQWRQSGIHAEIFNELSNRLSAISYSAFSWPFPRLNLTEDKLSNQQFNIPREYCVLLPISADLVLRAESEPEFHGYLGLFFDSFPKISEQLVELIVSLPPLLSEITAAYQRN